MPSTAAASSAMAPTAKMQEGHPAYARPRPFTPGTPAGASGRVRAASGTAWQGVRASWRAGVRLRGSR
jgi:hypothetical protein